MIKKKFKKCIKIVDKWYILVYNKDRKKERATAQRRLKMKYFVIEYENGEYRHGEFNNYAEALNYAESHNSSYGFTIEEYENEEDYLMNI